MSSLKYTRVNEHGEIERHCARCGEWKVWNLENFGASDFTLEGLNRMCRVCINRNARLYKLYGTTSKVKLVAMGVDWEKA